MLIVVVHTTATRTRSRRQLNAARQTLAPTTSTLTCITAPFKQKRFKKTVISAPRLLEFSQNSSESINDDDSDSGNLADCDASNSGSDDSDTWSQLHEHHDHYTTTTTSAASEQRLNDPMNESQCGATVIANSAAGNHDDAKSDAANSDNDRTSTTTNLEEQCHWYSDFFWNRFLFFLKPEDLETEFVPQQKNIL